MYDKKNKCLSELLKRYPSIEYENMIKKYVDNYILDLQFEREELKIDHPDWDFKELEDCFSVSDMDFGVRIMIARHEDKIMKG